ncbi:FAD/FMN-containing dehydrogenase [Gordonia terrae C-6]|uniref:FAD/FMN-containing dehydrogenase n=1 Tax=Gordonia terrae C-6 TaxID=1316928 RepID=R7Y6R7_9ACTN|nr:FAD-binding oxidoreductase [Gordonia terrae]EON31404.1 FAD/FMN-containing dehydrogenase [Gordonia terrae C-6]
MPSRDHEDLGPPGIGSGPRHPADISGVLTSLREIVGDANVLTDADATAGFLTDWTGRYRGEADAVVRPRTTGEVSRVIAECDRSGIRICVQGGNTGLVGGSVPPPGDGTTDPRIVLSTVRMTDIDEVDTVGRCVGVQAGATVESIDRRAGESGLSFGIDLASRQSATAGGVVATNAGGTRMIRRGNARSQILGIEAVLADGSVLRRWTSLVKDNVGYDLPSLLAGSEGTLAVITRVLFRLVTPPTAATVAVASVERVENAIDLIGAASSAGLTVEAAELMTEAGVALVSDHGHRRPTATPGPYYVLVELSGTGDIESAAAELLAATPGIIDAVLEPAPARALWAAREGHTEAIARSSSTPVVKLDISVPIRALPEAFAELSRVGTDGAFPCRPILFGHVGDGNIHVNLLDVPPEHATAVTDSVFGIVAANGGSISAEHGIGRAKVAWTHLGRDATDLATMRAIKAALDPRGLLNPGVLFG